MLKNPVKNYRDFSNKENMANEELVAYDSKLSEKIPLPLVEDRAIASFGGDAFTIEKTDITDYYVVPAFKDKKVDFMVKIDGSTMYPKYNSGDIVACRILDDPKFLQWNKVHVVATKDQGIIIKRIHKSVNGNLKMVSDIEKYPPFEVPEDQITGIALVVGVIRLE